MTSEMTKDALSAKVDVWALGVTFWSMIELRQPYQEAATGDNIDNMFYIANLLRRGDRLQISCPDCPHRLRLLIEACWQSDAVSRPTAKECASVIAMLKV